MKKLNKYFANQFTKLLRLLTKYGQTADQETLHKFRITIKKIKSLYRLINFCDNTFNYRKQFNPLKKIFADAGIIRNMYIAEKLINELEMEFKSEDISFNSDPDKRKENISSFIKRISSFQKIIYRKYSDTEKYLINVSTECFKEYSLTRLTDLKNMIYPELNEAGLHDARKICKEIIFLNEMDGKAKKNIDPFYDRLQEMIGEWHDKSDLLKLINEHNRNSGSIKTKKFKEQIQQDITSINELVHDHYNKAEEDKLHFVLKSER